MGKLLAFDYGVKRTGVAETDELKIIASGLDTVQTTDIWTFLDKYLSKNQVEIFVVGDPGEDTHNTVPANTFCEELSKKYPEIPVHRQDERFTSKMAFQSMIDGGVKKKKRREKGLIDKVSATLILQSYMNENGI